MFRMFRICLYLLGSTVMLLISTSVAFAAEPADPTPQEATDFAAKLQRLKDHKASMSTDVDEVIESLTSTVTKNVTCPESETSAINMVTINITTKHIKWDPNLTIGGKATNLPANRVGYYIWSTSSAVVEGKKTVTATNYVMLDPNVTTEQEADIPFGRLADETLLYHEFLHGELLINVMETDAAWKEKVCSCNFDLGPIDQGHVTISGLEESYLNAVAAGTANVKVKNIPPRPANPDGTFEVEVGNKSDFPSGKTIIPKFFAPDDHNISGPLVFDDTGEKLKIRGTLADKNKRGFFLVYLDPPTDVTFIGIESGIVVLPVTSVGGTTSFLFVDSGSPGSIVALAGFMGGLLALLAVITVWYVRRRWPERRS